MLVKVIKEMVKICTVFVSLMIVGAAMFYPLFGYGAKGDQWWFPWVIYPVAIAIVAYAEVKSREETKKN